MRLGISKSGPWYQKRRLVEGKSVMVYGKVLTKIEQSSIN